MSIIPQTAFKETEHSEFFGARVPTSDDFVIGSREGGGLDRGSLAFDNLRFPAWNCQPTSSERVCPIHLLMPFCSSVIVVFALLILKRAQVQGVTSWTSVIVVCWASAFVFPLLTVMGGTMQPLSMLWQPAILGALFLTGQLLTFVAVHRGDVSIAAPVLGVKVLMVPAFTPLFVEADLPGRVWIAAAIAVAGVGLVQARDASIDRSRIAASVAFAVLAAVSMTFFDLLIQRWASAWGAGYFLPITFGFAALFSLVFLPWADSPGRLKQIRVVRPLAVGALLMSVQAIGMTLTLGLFGDAARVNIVYSLRGLWGVLLTWIFAHHLGEADSIPSHRVMSTRLAGAALIGASVVIAVA